MVDVGSEDEPDNVSERVKSSAWGRSEVGVAGMDKGEVGTEVVEKEDGELGAE